MTYQQRMNMACSEKHVLGHNEAGRHAMEMPHFLASPDRSGVSPFASDG